MMAGVRVAMMTSALLKYGIGHLKEVQAYLLAWMEDHEYESIRQMQGSMARKSVSNPAAFERARLRESAQFLCTEDVRAVALQGVSGGAKKRHGFGPPNLGTQGEGIRLSANHAAAATEGRRVATLRAIEGLHYRIP